MNTSDQVNLTFVQCQLALSIVGSFNYKILLIAELVTALLSVPPNVLLLSVVRRVNIFPANLRLLIGHFSFLLLWFALGDALKSIYLLTAPTCGFIASILQCKILDLFSTVVVLPNMFYTLAALCTERLYATISYKNYDQTAAKKPWLSLLLLIFSYTCAFGIHGDLVFSLSNSDYVPICESTFVPSKSAVVYVCYVCLELLTFLTAFSIFFRTRFVARNMSINRALFDLSSRFQVDQNVRINKVLLPTVILHALCHVPTFALIIGARGVLELSPTTKAWMSRITLLWRLVYAFVHPILAFSFNRDLRNQLRRDRFGRLFTKSANGKNKKNADNDNNNLTMPANHIHFDYLNKQWTSKRTTARTRVEKF